MLRMVLQSPHTPLAREDSELLRPLGNEEIRLKVRACGVCRTDLHIVDGELEHPKLPLVLGHEVVATVVETGAAVRGLSTGDRVGVPWLAGTCGECTYCRSGRENLCEQARFTGYDIDGGYAEQMVADARYSFPIPSSFDDVSAAPLLCAGLIGYRSFRLSGEGKRLGLYGFGASAHIVAQVARHFGREVYVFTRPGDAAGQQFARSLGVEWVGGSNELPPHALDAAILFAPIGSLVPTALEATAPGGVVVCAGIHMSDIPSFPYRLLWKERSVRSVANLTRRDGNEFLPLAAKIPIRTTTTPLPLTEANEALSRLRDGRVEGALVLVPGPSGTDR